MDTVTKRESRLGKILKLLLKIGITILCFWYISTKINFNEAWKILLKANWWWLILAVGFYTLSKIISSLRLNIYFKNIGLKISEWNNLKLYWLGMFYNLFLPGAISGDAYKVIFLNKVLAAPYKKTSAAVLLDRFSGLSGLAVLLMLYGWIVLSDPLYWIVLITGVVLSVAILYLFTRFFFKDFLPGFFSTFFIGILVQAIQVVCVYCILKSIEVPVTENTWIFIFLASSAIAVLPLSLGGGLGTREVVFAEGARFFGLSPQLGVVISLLFYLNNLLSSVWGAYFIFYAPIRKTEMS